MAALFWSYSELHLASEFSRGLIVLEWNYENQHES